MSRILRKIKFRSFYKNKVKEVLIYALGEIILVVIGILIALKINNWNIERQNLHKEYEFLVSLEKEFDVNIYNLDKIIQRKKAGDESMKRVLNLTGKNNFQMDTIKNLDRIIQVATVPYSFNFQDGVLNTLLNSGQLELISNDSLKFFLAGCHSIVNDGTEESREAWRMTEEQLIPIMSKYYLDYLDPVPFSSKMDEMLRDRNFHNILKRVWVWNLASLSEHTYMRDIFFEMKQIIEKEKDKIIH